MKIETYEIEKPANEISALAADSEARELCEKLGLEGQLSLSNNESETTFPYRRMTKLEQRVFELHCPIKTDLQSYKSDAIPLRVLQVAAHAMSCNVLSKIYIWHPEEAHLDPVLVGYTSAYGGDLYLLARWGAVWKEFKVLVEEAKKMWIANRIAGIARAEKKLRDYKDSVALDANAIFSGSSNVDLDTYISI